MSKFQHDVMLKIVKVIDLVMITIPFALCWELYYSYQVYAKFGWRGNWAMISLFAVLFFLLGAHGPAFFWLVGLIVLVLFMIADFSRRNATAAWLSTPYLLWLLFAAYLNLGIWLLNR